MSGSDEEPGAASRSERPVSGPGTPERAPGRSAAAAYEGLWDRLGRWLRVPREAPTLPAGRRSWIESFRPDPGLLRYHRLMFWIPVGLLIPVWLGLLAGWAILLFNRPVLGILALPLLLGLAGLLALLYLAIRLRYDATWYVMTDRSVRIRRGIWVIRETTVTFENVQNVSVKQGPVQRYCGISSIVLETAGAGSASEDGTTGSQAVLEGIADPERVRELVMARVRRSRGAGLGDEDERAPPASGAAAWKAAHIAALREIREAARELAATR